MTGASETEPLIGGALSIGRELVATAEPGDGGCTWQSELMTGVEDGAGVIGHGDVGPTLYDGSAGIALALAAGATVAPADDAARFAETARGAARRALAEAPELLELDRLDLYGGATGIALGAISSARLLDDAALLESGTALARAVASRFTATIESAKLDLLGGLAGTMLGLQATLPAGDLTPLLSAAAARLAATAVPQTWGAAWPDEPGEPPLLGLGHGAAGIALALAEAAALSGDRETLRVCEQGLEYERGWFEPERGGWPDLRGHGQGDEPAGGTVAWCHGAIGIGLSRLRLAQLSGDPVLLAEASAALQYARGLVIGVGNELRAGRASDCTLCHGLAGAIELQLVASRALGIGEHERAARRVAALLLEQRQVGDGWPCGLPGAGQVPALMTGTAGIALTLLRLSGAVEVPTPLLPGPAAW